MYVECDMCADGEVLMMGVEESIGNSAKSAIHYHLVFIKYFVINSLPMLKEKVTIRLPSMSSLRWNDVVGFGLSGETNTTS